MTEYKNLYSMYLNFRFMYMQIYIYMQICIWKNEIKKETANAKSVYNWDMG